MFYIVVWVMFTRIYTYVKILASCSMMISVLYLYIYVERGRDRKSSLLSGLKLVFKKKILGDFPGGAMVKNPSANAGNNQGPGFNPWSGKIPHATEQLSPCATTTESTSHNY